jgi:putative peptidoglycan lipid II flippase
MAAATNGTRSQLLVSAAALVALSTLLSRLLGLVRDRLFAATFGAGPVLDAYFAAYRIPDLLFNLLILGTLSAAFLPVFTAYLSRGEKGRTEALETAHSLFTLTVIICSGLAVILFLLLPIALPILAPGFDPERARLAVQLSRIMLLQPILLGASSILGGMLTSVGRFFAYATAPVLYNIGIIAGVTLFLPQFGISGLAWGVVLGALLHLLVQVPGALRLGFRFRPVLTFRHEGIFRIGRLMVPRLIGLVVGQVGSLIVTIIGSTLVTGSIAVFSFAENLQAVPIGIVGISFAVAAFPQLSAAAARSAAKSFLETLIRSIRLILFLILPLSVAMLLLRAQIVRVVLGTGAFDWEDTVLTLNVLGILVLAVFAQSVTPLLARAFFALQDTRTPMAAGIGAIATNIVGAVILGRLYGVEGLAVAYAVASGVHFFTLLTLLHVRLGGLRDRELLSAVFRTGVAALAAGAAIQLLKAPIAAAVDMRMFWGVFIQLLGTSLGGLVVFILIGRLLKIEEIGILAEAMRRFRKARQPEPDAFSSGAA